MSLNETWIKPSLNVLHTCNQSCNVTETYEDLTQLSVVHITFVLLYLAVFATSFVGNMAVLVAILLHPGMQTIVNYYIFNLALCDLLISVFVLPSKMIELLSSGEWLWLNEHLCIVMYVLQSVIVFANLLTLVSICFERYFAIVHPLKSRSQQSKSRTSYILVAIWSTACVASLPNLAGRAVSVRETYNSQLGWFHRRWCFLEFEPRFRTIYYTSLFILLYVIPMLLIACTSLAIARSLMCTRVSHTRPHLNLTRQATYRQREIHRHKIGKMILVIAASFMISWTPYFAITIITQYQEENFMEHGNFFFTMLSINLSAFFNSAINPIIYAIMSARFRLSFVHIAKSVLCQAHNINVQVLNERTFSNSRS